MTGTETYQPHVPPDDGQQARRKGRLFCPVCGYESVHDWQTSEHTETGDKLRCPRCDTVVATH